MSHLNSPFIVQTFLETRGIAQHRVFHPMGTPAGWSEKRRIYNRLRLAGSGQRHQHEPPSSADIVLYRFYCQPDTYLVLADKTALLDANKINPVTVWWQSRDDRSWMLIEPDDIVILNFGNQIPDDHLTYDTFILRDQINDRSRADILNELKDRLGLPSYLMNYHEAHPNYEVTVLLPQAGTVLYRRLREEHLSG